MKSRVRDRWRERRRTVSFSTRDDVCNLPLELSEDDKEFIRVANVVLTKLQEMSLSTKCSSIFPRSFVQPFTTGIHLQNLSTPDFLTKETLSRFKQALFVRLDDRTNSPNPEKSKIQLMISKIIHYVDLVGWPDADDVDGFKNRERGPTPYHHFTDNEHNHQSILSQANSESYCNYNEENGTVKSSDWCLFKEERNGTIIDGKENVGKENLDIHKESVHNDTHDDVNVARSTIPSNLFHSSNNPTRQSSIIGIGGTFRFNKTNRKEHLEISKMDPRDNLYMYRSTDKATEEIFRLNEVISGRMIDNETKKYCLNRIEYLEMILEENGYHSID